MLLDRQTTRFATQACVVALLLVGTCSACCLVESTRDPNAPPIIGVDIGYTNTRVSYLDPKTELIQVLESDSGNRYIPSLVAWTPNGLVAGEMAEAVEASSPRLAFPGMLRMLGRVFQGAEAPLLRSDVGDLPYEVDHDKDGKPFVRVPSTSGGIYITPDEAISAVFREVKKLAEERIGQNVTDVVVTVPASFTDKQRQALKDAAAHADVNVLRIVNGWASSLIGFGMDKLQQEFGVVSLDMGASHTEVVVGTLDFGIFEVWNSSLNLDVGGNSITEALTNHVIKVLKKKHLRNIPADSAVIERVRREAEIAKRVLTTQFQYHMEWEDLQPGFDFSMWISRAKLEELAISVLKPIVDHAFQLAHETAFPDDEPFPEYHIILTGGASRLPLLEKLVAARFGRAVTVTRGVHPDEAAAIGVALQADVLRGGYNDAHHNHCFDLIPLSVGIKTGNGMFTKLLHRNTLIPNRKSAVFTTTNDNQDSIEVDVFAGERALASRNVYLTTIQLRGLLPAPRGVPKVRITMEVDVNGELEVTLQDLLTGKQAAQSLGLEARMDFNLVESHMESFYAEEEEEARLTQAYDSYLELGEYCDRVELALSSPLPVRTEHLPKQRSRHPGSEDDGHHHDSEGDNDYNVDTQDDLMFDAAEDYNNGATHEASAGSRALSLSSLLPLEAAKVQAELRNARREMALYEAHASEGQVMPLDASLNLRKSVEDAYNPLISTAYALKTADDPNSRPSHSEHFHVRERVGGPTRGIGPAQA